jgi:hypothetical protein
MKKIDEFVKDLEFICEECNGTSFEFQLSDYLAEPELFESSNRCRTCLEDYQNVDEIPFGLIYVRVKDGKKFLPSSVKLMGQANILNSN